MSKATDTFAVNSYSYALEWSALDFIDHLADQGYRGAELMIYTGLLWPDGLAKAARRAFKATCRDRGVKLISTNAPNIDINVAAATKEMRAYSLGLLEKFVRLTGDLGASGIVIGPGKASTLLALQRPNQNDHFKAALDILAPIAKDSGTRLLLENIPFCFLPKASEGKDALATYGNDDICSISEVANAHFIREDPG